MPILFDIPFDEPDGSNIAYDYSGNNNNAAIDSGNFIPGLFGNCVYFPNDGSATITIPDRDFSQDFSFMVWIKAVVTSTGPNHTYAVFKFPGINNYINIELFNNFTVWTHFAITQEGQRIKIYLNGVLSADFDRGPVPMTGWAVINDNPNKGPGFSFFDGGKSYQNEAVPPEDIIEIIENQIQPVNFFINNVDFKSLGIHVERIDGILDMPEHKNPLKVDWFDYSGEVVDLVRPVYGVRKFRLRCWFKAVSEDDRVDKCLTIRETFKSPGYKYLLVEMGSRSMPFMVYVPGEIEFENPNDKWYNQGPIFMKFDLNFEEPEPIKRVLRVNGDSVSITLTSPDLLTIAWGDNQRVTNISGTTTITHNYSSPGVYYINIMGNIDKITGFSTDATIVWGKI